MTPSELRAILDEALRTNGPHVERLTIAAAVISELLEQHGMVATLVGGGAIEFDAPGVHTTSDLDFVVEGRTRADLDAVLQAFGFERRGRHWVLEDRFVEVPGNWMSDPVAVVTIGALPRRPAASCAAAGRGCRGRVRGAPRAGRQRDNRWCDRTRRLVAATPRPRRNR